MGNNRDQRARAAKEHTEIMAKKYAEQIAECVKKTVLYDSNHFQNTSPPIPDRKKTLAAIDSIGAIFRYHSGKTAVLNFASYKHPGGGFLAGSKAQEECLCHESFLYNVLSQFPDYYEWNNRHPNRALYGNRALYSPDVIFLRDGKEVSCDVITCAAPNRTAALRQGVSEEENREALISRIGFVLGIAAEQNVDTLILGAFGCGVFGQKAEEVAQICESYLRKPQYRCFSRVVYAVPRGKDGNYAGFRRGLGME